MTCAVVPGGDLPISDRRRLMAVSDLECGRLVAVQSAQEVAAGQGDHQDDHGAGQVANEASHSPQYRCDPPTDLNRTGHALRELSAWR